MHHAADESGALPQARQSLSAADRGGCGRSPGRYWAVCHLDYEAVRFVAQRDPDRGARRVLVRIGQPFLRDAVRRPVDSGAEGPLGAGALQFHCRARSPRRGDQLVDGGRGAVREGPGSLRTGPGRLRVVPQDAHGFAQLPHRRSGCLSEDAHSFPLAAVELWVHLQRPGVHGDQGKLVAKAVVHVLGDALPLQQPGLARHHRLFAYQLGVVSPQGVQQGVPLGAVTGGETGRHRQHQERSPGQYDGRRRRQSEVFIRCGGHADGKVEDEACREGCQCSRRTLDTAADGPAGADQQGKRTEKGACQG